MAHPVSSQQSRRHTMAAKKKSKKKLSKAKKLGKSTMLYKPHGQLE
jgi:hypothetical protein